jgi:hypothetical protein
MIGYNVQVDSVEKVLRREHFLRVLMEFSAPFWLCVSIESFSNPEKKQGEGIMSPRNVVVNFDLTCQREQKARE